jgi:hypothetical protein
VNREAVTSTSIASVGYDGSSRTLEVEFVNRTVYQYYEVGAEIFRQLMEAPSKGRFLNTCIRDAFRFSRVE